ncbi:MAG: hypothetical protein AAFV53_27480 [Myxococcota bacterium]
MALSEVQKADCRRYLGYSDRDRGLYNALEGALTALSPESEVRVGTLLTRLNSLEDTLFGAVDRQKVVKAEDVILAGAAEVRTLWAMGNRMVSNLASILGVASRAPYFSSTNASSTSGFAHRG